MPTLAPPNREQTTVSLDTDSTQLTAALHPWRRRLLLQQLARWTGSGIIAGLILADLVLLMARIVPWATALYWALGLGLLCLLGACVLVIWYRPSLARTAHQVDSRLSLHDRLGTAWEMRDETAVLYRLQRRDALKQLGKHTPRTAISLRPQRSRLLAVGIAAVILVLLLLLPNPQIAVLQQQAALQARLNKQIAAIDHLRTTLDHQSTIPAQQRAQIDQILHDLETKLQNTKNETQAQQALAEAQARLNQLRDPQATNRLQAHAAASSSLQNSANANLGAIGSALANNDSKRLASSLQNLASQVSKMTSAQRLQLAQQIEKAANQAQQNPQLSSALHQLAKSIADGNASEIADASNAVEAAASQDAATQSQSSGIDQATQGLEQTANSLTSSTDGTTTQGQQGQGQQGQGQGQGPGQGQGQGGSGNSGTGGQNNNGSKSGKNEQVFVPGQIGSGTSTQSNNGTNGVVQNGSSVPYSQVIAQYNQLAHDAIDNSPISPDLKDLVQGYFSALEGQ